MMIKRQKKLLLGRETLRRLEDREATRAVGGVQTAKTVCASVCATNCLTCNTEGRSCTL